MILSRVRWAQAPVCENCYDYADDSKIVERKRGWVHVCNNSMRCPGQEDDDTDDRAEPLRDWRTGRYVVGFDKDGNDVLAGTEKATARVLAGSAGPYG